MKKILIFLLTLTCFTLSYPQTKALNHPLSLAPTQTKFIHPLDFNGSKGEKDKVISYIEELVENQMALIGMESNVVSREMEEAELVAFKKLTKAKDRKLLNNLISQLRYTGNISYIVLEQMYDYEISASDKKLEW